jgi:hypothetical protein
VIQMSPCPWGDFGGEEVLACEGVGITP